LLKEGCVGNEKSHDRAYDHASEEKVIAEERSEMKFSHEEARIFYDRLGPKQDWQRFYEKSAITDLIRHFDLGSAKAVIEFGCGTGWLAELLLADYLLSDAQYVGVDISATMVKLSQRRLEQFGPRAKVLLTEGEMRLDFESDNFDRFLSTYVMDLLSEKDIESLIAEAHRILTPGGLLGLVSLTEGYTLLTRLLEKIWSGVYRLRPALVGGCRPVSLGAFVNTGWNIRHLQRMKSLAVPSEVLVAEKK
jgi:ubiquinone/menaquinone biosynthesis C-methylase UbiE